MSAVRCEGTIAIHRLCCPAERRSSSLVPSKAQLI